LTAAPAGSALSQRWQGATLSAQVRLEEVIVAAGRFPTSADIGFRSSVTVRTVWVVIDVAVRTASRSAGDPEDRRHFCRDKALNFAAHSPEDSQRDRKCRSARLERPVPKGFF
jgi:hypothetical protein